MTSNTLESLAVDEELRKEFNNFLSGKAGVGNILHLAADEMFTMHVDEHVDAHTDHS